jgi:hypothetical protein
LSLCSGLSSWSNTNKSSFLLQVFHPLYLSRIRSLICSENSLSSSRLSLSYSLCLSLCADMASATACASTAFAGQTVLKQSSELSIKVGTNEARVQMRSRGGAPSSIWSALCPCFSRYCFVLMQFSSQISCLSCDSLE